MQKNFFIASLSRLGSELRILTKRSFQNFFCKSYQIAKVNGGEKMVGGTNGGINHVVNYLSVVFHCVELMFESGLRTIGTSIDVNGRLFLCLKSSIRKAFRDFPFNRSQSESTHIKSLVSIEPSIYAGSIMVVYSQRHMEGELLWL